MRSNGARWDEAAQLGSYFVDEAHGACELPMITAELPGAG